MRNNDLPHPRLLLVPVLVLLIPIISWTQEVSPQSRITKRIDEAALTTLRGNTHPYAQAQYDRGTAPTTLPMERMLLVLKRSSAQEVALQKLLEDQQNQSSPNYHKWLSPDEFGLQFGPSDQDIQAVASWLGSHGFQVARMSKGRTVIEFSGTAGQVADAFHTEIHKYMVNGEQHWANASDPQIPDTLTPVVTGVNSLHNFPRQPMNRIAGVFSKSKTTGKVEALNPDFTITNSSRCGASGGHCYFVSPYDFAAIYNVLPLWNGTPAIDGTGQSIAIVGESNINVQDVRDFRNLFGLPANDPQVIVDGPDPGIVSGPETEALVDVEWSGAVAKGATIKYVPSASTNSSAGIDLSAVYVVENNLAPVVSESFGECELFLGTAGNSFENAIRQQAAAQGITFINSSGDEGAARCDPETSNPPVPATHGLAVSGLASSPYGVAVGGTDFANFGANYAVGVPSPYWSLSNDPNQASALGYIPETTWNSTCTNSVFIILGAGSTPEASCNNSSALNWVETVGGGGGKSSCIASDGANVSSCSGGYSKPSWQSAPGVPQDGARDIPDVSLFASSGFTDSAYMVCESDRTSGSCNLANTSNFLGGGGTSVSAPAFAGILALVNQFTHSAGQGNANYVLYKLASIPSQTSLNCNSSASPSTGCIFRDVTSGTNAVPCARNSPNCSFSNANDTYGVISGYGAGTGYDLATGLGSVNAYNLVHDWNQATFTPTTTTLSLNGGSPVNITHGQSVNLNISVSPNTATGDVSLFGSPHGSDSVAMGGFTLQSGSVNGATTLLGGGNSYQVKAHYAGNGIYASSDSNPVTVTISPEPSKTLISIPVFDPTTGKETGNSPASLVYGSHYIAQVDVGGASATLTYPPQAACSQPACPTGSVTITDSLNGGTPTPLNGVGIFPLNSDGYTNYNAIQLSGGMHQLSASYQGDLSYSQSSGIYSLLVTAAAGTKGSIFVAGTSPNISGVTVTLDSTFSSTVSNGAAPTGTITFYDGANAISGTPVLMGIAGIDASLPARIQAGMDTSFSTSGVHQITARYSGDANYAGAISDTWPLSVMYPTSTTVSLNSTAINFGESITINAIVTTSIKNPPITGTFRVAGDAANTAPIVPTRSIDASGNQVLSATTTITPQVNENINVMYSGDSNYAASFGDEVHINVTIPDFNLVPGAATLPVTAGQTGSTMVTITPKSSASSTVALSCNVRNIAGATCSFSPISSLNLSGGAAASTTLMITTLPPSSSTSTSRLVAPRLWPRPIFPAWLPDVAILGALSLLLFLFGSKRMRPVAITSCLVCVGFLLLGCGSGSGGGSTTASGGGGSSSGGGSGGIVVTSTSLKLSTSAVKVSSGAPVTLTAAIVAAHSVEGTVTFVDAGAGTLATIAVSNGQAVAQFSNLSVGTHVISANYSGDVTDYPSSSNGSINQVITGTAQVTISGTTSTLTNTTAFNMTIQ